MRESRNPFRLRAAEQIESDATFLRLFEPAVLDAIPETALTTPVLMLRSAPGAGKTSLLRLFTPAALRTIRANAAREEYRDLYERLRRLGAIDEARIRTIGIRLSCAQTFASLDDAAGGSDLHADRLLFGLLNARILLGAFRDLADLAHLSVPDVLSRSKIQTDDATRFPLLDIHSGYELFDWARRLEVSICSSLDSFVPTSDSAVGHDSLHSLQLLATSTIHLDDVVAPKFVVMLDDFHLLTSRQRQHLVDELIRLRMGTPVWLAQRYEAMAPAELFSLGAVEGRDVVTVYLEQYWRSNSRRFEVFVQNVADRRATSAGDGDLSAFATCLEESLDPDRWGATLEQAIEVVRGRISAVPERAGVFAEWIAQREASTETPYERAIEWRALEILVERERRRDQMSFGLPMTSEELQQRDDADVRHAAQLFLSREFGLPMYFGAKTVATLASSNVDQYLSLAGDLFEEAVSAVLIQHGTTLSPERQDAIMRAAAEARWSEIPTRVADGRRTREFIGAVGLYASVQTYRPTAPYSPGITGIAYAMADHARLLKHFPDLATTIASAIADNLLEPHADYKCKGRLWMVLYLNRLLCAHFRLPVGYGGFKEQRLTDLQSWLTHGTEAVNQRFL